MMQSKTPASTNVAVFLHSTGMGPFMWQKAATLMPSSLVAVCPVNVGYPPLAPVPRGETKSLADDLASAVNQIPAGAESVHLFAHSYGALLALKLALGGTLPVKSVWVYEPVMYGALHLHESLAAEVRAEVDRLVTHPAFRNLDVEQGGSDEWLQAFIDHWNGPGAWNAMPPKLKAMTLALGWKMYLEVRAQGSDTARFADFKLDVPLTVVAGRKTTAASLAMAEALAAANPGARLEVLEGVGHMAPVTDFDRVAPSILSHLKAVAL